jgi:Ala-tRNA(Pro) deacylase
MTTSVTDTIRNLLKQHGVSFHEVQHEPTLTSEESAKARGEDLRTGAKAIVLKTDDEFQLFVLAADSKLDSAAIKRHLGVKKLRFATSEELFGITGLVPGSVPPFGAPVLPLRLYADSAVGAATGKVAFNAGSLTLSIVMAAGDWQIVASPIRFPFRRDEDNQRGSVNGK